MRESRPPPVATQTAAGISCAQSSSCKFELPLEGAAITDLFKMTPHYYRVTEEAKARALALSSLTLTVDVRLELWRKP
ncbi:MAG: hypothetical protein EOP11_05135 [Proteobacteria bacterium]|nr:MAG: hypothetical protein EOP11_05135 [Pseudomonadota bacterium]